MVVFPSCGCRTILGVQVDLMSNSDPQPGGPPPPPCRAAEPGQLAPGTTRFRGSQRTPPPVAGGSDPPRPRTGQLSCGGPRHPRPGPRPVSLRKNSPETPGTPQPDR